MTATTTIANATILYIDDDSDDCLILRSSLKDSGSNAKLVYLSSGEEAVSYLDSLTPSGFPNLIVLDINMPRWNGFQTLSYLKADPRLAGIPVVVLSTSESKADKESCMRLGAASYFKKPYRYDDYLAIVNNFPRYMKSS